MMRTGMGDANGWYAPEPAYYYLCIWHAIVSNMTHFYILFGMREKMAFYELCVSPVLTQNQGIWNFHGSLTLNNGKLI